MTNAVKRSLALAAALAAVTPAFAATVDESKPSFEIYGFAQVDYIQDFDRVNNNWQATLRPSRIPTTEGQFGGNGQAIISARQSRLGAQGLIPTDHGAVRGRFEFDMFGVGVDEGQTTIRLRHAYGSWKQLLGGQTHSLFMDVDVFPNVIDYWGPTGMVFLRLPQLRWTPYDAAEVSGLPGKTSLAFAIETPGSDIDTGQLREIDPALGANLFGDNELPDFTAQVRNDQDWGHVQLGAILRRVGFETRGAVGPSGHKTAWGTALTSNVKTVGKSKFDLSVLAGQGIASYMNDGGMDMAPETRGDGTPRAKAVPLWAFMAYYDHYFGDKWSTTFGYSRTQVRNTDLQLGSAYHSGEYASGNLVYYPTKDVFFGAEFLWGQRRDSGGAKGIDRRVQVTAHYNFSTNALFAKLNP